MEKQAVFTVLCKPKKRC